MFHIPFIFGNNYNKSKEEEEYKNDEKTVQNLEKQSLNKKKKKKVKKTAEEEEKEEINRRMERQRQKDEQQKRWQMENYKYMENPNYILQQNYVPSFSNQSCLNHQNIMKTNTNQFGTIFPSNSISYQQVRVNPEISTQINLGVYNYQMYPNLDNQGIYNNQNQFFNNKDIYSQNNIGTNKLEDLIKHHN